MLGNRVKIRGEAFVLLALWLLLMPRWVGPMLLAAAVHELGHLAALWAFGVRVSGMEIGAGGARLIVGEMDPGTELCCALAGPTAGALLCLFWRWIPQTAVLALGQTVFNLLPFGPMDGGRAFRAARNMCCKRPDFGVQ